jgi:FxsC-like protein
MAKDYWFFLSYARNDAQGNPWLNRFYEDLARDVRSFASVPSTLTAKDIGFIDDIGLENGTQWTVELTEALQTSKVLVCLYSRSYFNSQWCGKEFRVFLDRLKAFVGQTGAKLPPLIQPVLWDAPEDLPPIPKLVQDLALQHANAEFGEAYVKEGLAQLIRLRKEEEYERFLLAFRRRVVKVAQSSALPPLGEWKPWTEVRSAFDPEATPATTPTDGLPEAVPLPVNFGPRVAWFVYVAGRDQSYAGVRTRVDCYGDQGGALWKPYFPPDTGNEAGIIAQKIVTGRNMLRETLPVSKKLVEHLRDAEKTNTIVLLIVDPWSLKLSDFQAPLNLLDQQLLFNCGVVVIWNEQDAETTREQDDLRKRIEKTFERYSVSQDIFFRPSVKSEAELEAELAAAIESVSKKIMKRAKPLRPVDNTSVAFPKLDVPTRALK